MLIASIPIFVIGLAIFITDYKFIGIVFSVLSGTLLGLGIRHYFLLKK